MYDKVFTKLLPEATAFDLPLFSENYENITKKMIEHSKAVNEKSKALNESYLKMQDLLVKISQH